MSEAVIEEGVEEQENELPELPEGWSIKRLGDLGKWSGGGTPSKKNDSFWEGGTVPWVSPKDMKTPILSGTQDRITEQATRESAAKPKAANSVALVTRSGILEHSLPVAFVPFAAAFNQDMKVIEPSGDIDPRWLLWALAGGSQAILDQCRKDGTTVASIDFEKLQDFPLVVPPLDAQHLLVAELEARLGEISELSAQLDVVENLQDQFCQALLRDAFTGRLTNGDDLPDPDEVDEAGRPALPEGWRWRPLKELGDLVRGVTYKKPQASSEGGPGLVRLLRATNISDQNGGTVDLEESLFVPRELVKEVQILREGDLLMVSSSGSRKVVGKSAMLDGGPEDLTFGAFCTVFRPNGGVLSSYLRWLFRGPRFRSMISEVSAGSNINNLKRDDLLNLEVPVPSTGEQAEIARVVQAQLDQADEVEQFISEVRAQLESVRASLLHQAFSGQLIA